MWDCLCSQGNEIYKFLISQSDSLLLRWDCLTSQKDVRLQRDDANWEEKL